jgi:hypothetical protein
MNDFEIIAGPIEPEAARIFMYARAFAEINKAQLLQEQRVQNLTERMACLDDDIERITNMIGRMNGAPTLWPYQDDTLRRV